MQIEALVIIGAVVAVIAILAIRNKKPKGGRAPKPGEGIPKERK
jgi:hypothetical protein